MDGVDVVVRRNAVNECCPKPILERNKTCLTVLAAIGSTVITQQIMTKLSSGFNSIGFVASDQVKTIELSWSSSVLHLETTSGMLKVFQNYPECMFFVWLFIVGLWQMRWFGNFGAKKQKIQQQKGAVWHIISNPLDPTRRTKKDPPIPFQCWHGPQVIHLPTVHTNYMTCRYMMIHVVCYCRAWNLTWHFHFDHTRSALSTVTSRLHLL